MMEEVIYDDPHRKEPFFLKRVGRSKRYDPVRICDYSASEHLFECETPDGWRGWFFAEDIYADRKGRPVRFDPAFHEAQAALQRPAPTQEVPL